MLPMPSHAASAASTEAERDLIVVTGTYTSDSFTAQEGRSALKMDVPLIRTPQSVQIIPQEVILVQAATQLSDVLRNVSGITDNNSFGGVQDNFNLRGFNTDNNDILRDGYMSISDRALNGAVERVEVLKGPSSLLYGRFSPGGLVNVVTKKPLDSFYANLSTSHSTRGQSRQAFDVTGPVAPGVAIRLIGEYEDSDAWRNVGHGNKSKFIAPSIRIGNDSTSLLAQYEYFDNDQGFDRGRVAFDGAVIKLPATRSLGEDFAYYRQTVHNANLLFSQQLGGGWHVDAKASGQWEKHDDLQVRPRGLALDASGNPTGFFRRSVDGNKDAEARAYYISVNIGGRVETGPLTHTLLLGVDHNRLREGRGYSVDSPARADFNIFDPVYGLLDANLALLQRVANSNYVDRRRSTGFYAQDLVEIGSRWSLLLGGRYDRFSSYSQNGVALPTDDSSGDTFLPRVAALYQPLKTVSIYASFSRSFKPNAATPPQGGQPAFGPFPPEKGRGYEIGIKSLLFSRVNVTLAAFDIKKQNVLRSETDGNGNSVTTASAEVTSKGVELDVAGEIAPGVSLIATYSYIKARDPQNITGDRRVLNVAPHKATLSAMWRPQAVPGLSAGGGVYHYGRRYGGLSGSPSGARVPFYLDAYTTAELYAGYEVSLGAGRPTLYMRLTLRNLGNLNYDQISNGDLRIDPGQARTLFGTVGLRF